MQNPKIQEYTDSFHVLVIVNRTRNLIEDALEYQKKSVSKHGVSRERMPSYIIYR